MNKLTHLNEKGEANIVDISSKKPTKRSAIAEGKVSISEATLNLIISNNVKKGDVLSIARIAGIISSKTKLLTNNHCNKFFFPFVLDFFSLFLPFCAAFCLSRLTREFCRLPPVDCH